MPKKVEDIRNLALCGHGSSGKTTMVDKMLVKTGAVSSNPSVDDGTSVCDFDPEEKDHKYTIEASLVHFEHNKKFFNVIDTPGYPDFIGQTIGALNGVDMANQWDLLGVESSTGANYGLVHQWTGRVQPQLFSLRMWSLMGDTLRPVTVADDLEVYATSSSDGGVQLLVLNPEADARSLSLRIDGAGDAWQATADVVEGADLRAEAVTYNGQTVEQATDIDTTPIDLGAVGSDFEHEFAPFSITVLRLAPS